MTSFNIKAFLRHLLKRKLLTLINVLGLSVGLASVLLLSLYVKDEVAKDHQHPAVAQKYRIDTVISAGDEVLHADRAAPLAATFLQDNFSEVVDVSRYYAGRFYVNTEQGGDGFYEERIGFADDNVGSFFSFVWVQGSPEVAWRERNSIVLTESLAQKYFQDGRAMGQVLWLNNTEAFTVTGIIRDPSLDSHIDLQAIVPMAALPSLSSPDFLQSWFNIEFRSYVQLKPGVAIAAIWPAMAEAIESSMPPPAQQLFSPAWIPVTDIYLEAALNSGTQRTRGDDVRILFGISLAILLVACINFVNLTTARSADRHKELAIRKVAGSSRWRLFVQYMGESSCLVLLALLLALAITEFSLPPINAFTGKQLALLDAGNFWWAVLGIAVATTLLAGVYPALYLSRLGPSRLFGRAQAETRGFLSLRNLLVLFQFAVAISAIVAASVMVLQLRFVEQRDLGFDASEVLVIENAPGAEWELFKQQVRNRTEIDAISAAQNRPFRSVANAILARYEGSAPTGENLSGLLVDFDYFALLGVDLIAGRGFSESIARDRRPVATEENPHPQGTVMLNLAMVRKLGWTPSSALGKQLEFQAGPGQDFARSLRMEVVGVVDDMYVDAAQRNIVPLFFYVPTESNNFDFLFLKLNAQNARSQQEQVKAIWKEIYPAIPANMYLLEDKQQALYQRETRQSNLLVLFAALAVLISCMGLIGLATYATEQRVKELGVRKVVGASVLEIVMLFSREFSQLVLVSNLLAWPIAYLVMQRWLSQFAYRIDLTPLIFIGSGAIALCIAWVTVGGIAAKAASAKPVLALRYE